MSDLHKYERFRTRKGRTIWVCKVPELGFRDKQRPQ